MAFPNGGRRPAAPTCSRQPRVRTRKTDSNSWSHRERNGCERAPGGATWVSDMTLTGFGFRAGVLDGRPAAEPFAGAGPAVRIRLAPAASLLTIGSAAGEEGFLGFWAASVDSTTTPSTLCAGPRDGGSTV